MRPSACISARWYQQHLFSTTKCASSAKATFAFSAVTSRPLNCDPFLLRALRLLQPPKASTALLYGKLFNCHFYHEVPFYLYTSASNQHKRLFIICGQLDDRGLTPGKIRNFPLRHYCQIRSRAYQSSTVAKRVKRVRGEKLTTPQQKKVEFRCSTLTFRRRIFFSNFGTPCI